MYEYSTGWAADASQVVQLKAIVSWTDIVYLDMLRKYSLIRDDMLERYQYFYEGQDRKQYDLPLL